MAYVTVGRTEKIARYRPPTVFRPKRVHAIAQRVMNELDSEKIKEKDGVISAKLYSVDVL